MAIIAPSKNHFENLEQILDYVQLFKVDNNLEMLLKNTINRGFRQLYKTEYGDYIDIRKIISISEIEGFVQAGLWFAIIFEGNVEIIYSIGVARHTGNNQYRTYKDNEIKYEGAHNKYYTDKGDLIWESECFDSNNKPRKDLIAYQNLEKIRQEILELWK